MADGNSLSEALKRLDEVTRKLRTECPWDREQDEVSIVPHTVEEAYELAEAARNGDDAAMRDELGDVLFQVVFLSLLLEERGEGDLTGVVTQLTEKLIRRHPHVYPPTDTEANPAKDRPEGEDGGATGINTAADVRRQWDQIKEGVEGRTSEADYTKPGLPSLIYASKVQWKLDPAERPANAGADRPNRAADVAEVAELLWQAVELSRQRGLDAELVLRTEAERRASELPRGE